MVAGSLSDNDTPGLAASVALEMAFVLIFGLVDVGAGAAIVIVLLLGLLSGLLFFLDVCLLDLLDQKSVEKAIEVRRIIWLSGPNPVILFFEVTIVGWEALEED
jgi:hypothetical protein